MKVKPVLDKWELKGLQRIEMDEDAVLVEHKVPGLKGSLFQNLGTRPGRIFLSGSIKGDEVKEDFLEEIRKKFKTATPVSFIADITTASEIKEVIIENLFFAETAHNTETVHYKICLQEFTKSPQDESFQVDAIEEDIDSAAKLEVEAITDSIIEEVKADALKAALPEGLAKSSSLLDDLENLNLDAIKELAEVLGFELPPLGYEKMEEVLEDLMEGAKGLIGKDKGELVTEMGMTFSKIIPKLLLTLLGGGEEGVDWKELAEVFKKNLKNFLDNVFFS